MYFDRFDLLEAYACLAHDWGLYALYTRISRVAKQFRPDLTYDTLTDNGKAIYDHWDVWFKHHDPDPYSSRPMRI